MSAFGLEPKQCLNDHGFSPTTAEISELKSYERCEKNDEILYIGNVLGFFWRWFGIGRRQRHSVDRIDRQEDKEILPFLAKGYGA